MKLYTEEQVIELCMLFGSYYNYSIKRTKQIIEENQKPIELPSDEEIEQESHNYFIRGQLGFEAAADTERAFLRGVLWMRDKIQGGNQ